jgi:tetratricopeptide (TPR) repeat protein
MTILAIIFIIIGGIGSIISGLYPALGILLTAIGIIWALYESISTNIKNREIDSFMEAQAILMAKSGIGNPYTQIVRNEFKRKGKCNNALKVLDKALQVNPDDADALEIYVTIMALIFSFRQWAKGSKYDSKNKEWQFAHRLAIRGYRNNQHMHIFLDLLGILYDVVGEHKEARKKFIQASKFRKDPYWHLYICRSYLMSGKEDLALKEIEQAIEKGAKGLLVDWYYADCLLVKGSYEKALFHINRAIKIRGHSPRLLDTRQVCLFALGHLILSSFDKIVLSAQLVMLNVKRSSFLLIGAIVHLFISLLTGLSKIVWPFTSHIPVVRNLQFRYVSPIEPQFTIGNMMLEKGHYDAAIELFNKCKNIYSKSIDVLNNLACAYAYAGDRKKAVEIIDEALLIDPNNEILLNNKKQYESNIKLNLRRIDSISR